MNLIITLFIVLFGHTNQDDSHILVSDVDQKLILKKVMILPVTDNVSGFFAEPLYKKLKNLVETDRKIELVEYLVKSDKHSIQFLDDHPKIVKSILTEAQANGAFSILITRGPNGTQITLKLYHQVDGLILAQKKSPFLKYHRVENLELALQKLYFSLKRTLPFEGEILSRYKNNVTLNVGKEERIRAGDTVTAILITQLNRHPSKRFIVGSKKEVVGTIKITKVEKGLSFGQIASERAAGQIKPGTKVDVQNFVNYPTDQNPFNQQASERLADRGDADVSFGDDPQEWTKEPPPSFGKVWFIGGLGSYKRSTQLETTAYSARASLVPEFEMGTEIWIDTKWSLHFDFRHGIYSFANPRDSSEPGDLSGSKTLYHFDLGYNFLLGPRFFGPKIQAMVGYFTNQFFVDGSSPPAFNSNNYRGWELILNLVFDIPSFPNWMLGGGFRTGLSTSLIEPNFRSGSKSTNSMTEMNVLVDYKMNQRLSVTTKFIYHLSSTTFSGSGNRPDNINATSTSHTTPFLGAGVTYRF